MIGRLKHDKAVSNYRNILESKWISKQEGSLYPIPCVLGAFYGVRISWYRYIDGFRGHRYWGTLEPFISMKSWLAGGWCKIATDIETGHLFKKSGSHYTRGSDLLYNKMAIAKILFSKSISDFMIRYLGDNQDVRVAKELIKFDKEKIDELHDRFQAVKHRDIHWYNERFPLKYYELIKGYTDETRHTF